jgi:RNA polymerase sigma-70 factor (ECF subfamily)
MPATPAPTFAPTRWSIILAAQGTPDPAARRALNELAQTYWFPLYAFLRRNGHNPAEAEDLVQGFFARLLEKNALASVDQAKGKFRSFLLASLKNFTANQRDHAHAAKRGGTQKILPLDAADAESRYALEPAHNLTPDRLFERRWALALLDNVLAQLRHDYAKRNQSQLFAALESHLVGPAPDTYAALAQELAISESALKVAAHRLRKRYRDLLRQEVAQTLPAPADPAQINEELRALLATL